MSKVIITAAICGAEVSKEQQPALPVSANELALEAKRAVDAGASVIHLHVRNPDGSATQDKQIFKDAISEIVALCSPVPIIQPSTGGAVGMTPDERLQAVSLLPEMATLDCGTINFGDEVFINDFPMMRHFAETMQKNNILPELECFDISHIVQANRLFDLGLLNCHKHFNFVLGIPGAIDASAQSLVEMQRRIEPDATFTVSAIGRFQSAMIMMGLAMGGHIRVGFEDNIYLSKGVLADSNARFVEKVVRLAKEVGREVASIKEAREILHLERDAYKRLLLD